MFIVGGPVGAMAACLLAANDYMLPFPHALARLGNNRDQLRRHYNLQNYFLNVGVDDLIAYNNLLASFLNNEPSKYFPLFEAAAREAADQVTAPREVSTNHPLSVSGSLLCPPPLTRRCPVLPLLILRPARPSPTA